MPNLAISVHILITNLGYHFVVKKSIGHPTPTPGIFTIYCPHGVCYGFEILQECGSPRHPFQIFKTRFLKPPNVIVYDNVCTLHQYCLNREPEFFKSICFLVDRFHWEEHIGCSAGYNLDEYSGMNMPLVQDTSGTSVLFLQHCKAFNK